MTEILERHNLHAKNLAKLDKPSLELQLENSNYARLSKEVSEKSHQLRQMRGEELKELNIEELQKLEKTLETGLSRVLETKSEKIMKEISTLHEKGLKLLEENEKLRQQMVEMTRGQRNFNGEIENLLFEEGQSSESVTNVNGGPPPDNDSSDTSLKLGALQIVLRVLF
ncbi:hypothetical protein ACHQM5_024089 [Ranunculus cassubicifolius]